MTPTDLDIYITSDLIYMVLKSKIFIERNVRNLTVETFIRIVSWIWMSNAFFWLEIIIYEVWYDKTSHFIHFICILQKLLLFRESLLVLSQLSTPTSSLFTEVWTLLMSLSDVKTVVSSAKWTKRIWVEDVCMSLIYKRKSTGHNTDSWGAQGQKNNVWDFCL